MEKNLYIIAGCNGAGKTTTSFTILPDVLDCKDFVNADEIAKGLSPWSIDLAKSRVATRVKEGGHHIPADTIERRYKSGINNLFNIYLQVVDDWFI